MLAESFFSPPEIYSSPSLEDVTTTAQESQLGLFWHGMTAQLRNSLVTLTERVLPKKELKIWSSQRYFAAHALAQTSAEQAAVYQELNPDLESVYDEHSFNKLGVCYKYGPNGIRNGYSQGMVEIAENFLTHIKSMGLPSQRAELEVAVAQYATAWMASNAVGIGEKLVFISPRGRADELYPGLQQENHVFVNILEKTETDVIFYEFRNYDSHQELPRLQERIKNKSGGFIQQISQLHPDYYTQHIITQFVHVPAAFSISEIISEVHFNKQKWKINIDTQLPKLDETATSAQSLKVREFCIEKFKLIASETIPLTEKVAAFDLLIDLVRKELNKWVENNATNYDRTQQTKYDLHLDLVEQVWQIKRKKLNGEKLEVQEASVLKNFSSLTQLNPALPLERMTSLAHCIVGTPTSLLKIQAVSGSAPSLISAIQVDGSAFSALSLAERQQYIQELQRYVRVTLAGEVWYVPPEYLSGKGCYVDPTTGLAMGPCGLPLSHPLETNAKRETEYYAILEGLQSGSAVAESMAGLSNDQQEQLQILYFSLLKYLFVASAGLEKILHQDILKPQHEVSRDLQEPYQEIRASFNPLHQLVLYLVRLAQTDTEQFDEFLTHYAPQ